MDLKTFMEEHKYKSFLSTEESILYYRLLSQECKKNGNTSLAYTYDKMAMEMERDFNQGVDNIRNSISKENNQENVITR